VEINGKVGGNVLAFGSRIVLSKKSEVAWDASLYGEQVEIGGLINGRADAKSNAVLISGRIARGGKIDVGGDGEIKLAESAIIDEDMACVTAKPVIIASGAQVAGELKQVAPKVDNDDNFLARINSALWWFGRIIKLFGLLLIGLVIISLFKKPVKEITEEMIKNPGKNILWGMIYFIVVPLFFFLLFFTVIGIPLALIGLALYLISVYIAKVLAGIALGFLILSRTKKKDSLMLAMIAGLLAILIICSVPLVGWIFSIIVMWWGLGIIALKIRAVGRKK